MCVRISAICVKIGETHHMDESCIRARIVHSLQVLNVLPAANVIVTVATCTRWLLNQRILHCTHVSRTDAIKMITILNVSTYILFARHLEDWSRLRFSFRLLLHHIDNEEPLTILANINISDAI